MNDMKSISKELVGAASVLIILSVLSRGDSYGYEIVQKVKEFTGGAIKWKVSSIYPVLKKLENNGMIKSYWKVVEGQRPRKYYILLKDGREKLQTNIQEWNLVNSVFGSLLKT